MAFMLSRDLESTTTTTKTNLMRAGLAFIPDQFAPGVTDMESEAYMSESCHTETISTNGENGAESFNVWFQGRLDPKHHPSGETKSNPSALAVIVTVIVTATLFLAAPIIVTGDQNNREESNATEPMQHVITVHNEETTEQPSTPPHVNPKVANVHDIKVHEILNNLEIAQEPAMISERPAPHSISAIDDPVPSKTVHNQEVEESITDSTSWATSIFVAGSVAAVSVIAAAILFSKSQDTEEKKTVREGSREYPLYGSANALKEEVKKHAKLVVHSPTPESNSNNGLLNAWKSRDSSGQYIPAERREIHLFGVDPEREWSEKAKQVLIHESTHLAQECLGHNIWYMQQGKGTWYEKRAEKTCDQGLCLLYGKDVKPLADAVLGYAQYGPTTAVQFLEDFYADQNKLFGYAFGLDNEFEAFAVQHMNTIDEQVKLLQKYCGPEKSTEQMTFDYQDVESKLEKIGYEILTNTDGSFKEDVFIQATVGRRGRLLR